MEILPHYAAVPLGVMVRGIMESLLDAAAFAQASEEIRQNYQNPAMHRFRESLMLGMLREHVRPLLKHREQALAEA